MSKPNTRILTDSAALIDLQWARERGVRVIYMEDCVRRGVADVMAEARAIVISMHTRGCPIGQQLNPDFHALQAKYEAKGVKFMMINPNMHDTPEMIAKAKENAMKLGYANVEFRQGDIEDLPLSGNMVDVVVSNCVLNLVPDKRKAFAEMHRVLRVGGHFSVSDIVLTRELPDELRQAAELYAGCVTGASQEADYLGLITEAGFTDVQVLKRKAITIPGDILSRYLSAEAVENVKNEGLGIESITVRGEKTAQGACCGPGSSCC